MLASLDPYEVILISMETPIGLARRTRLNFAVQHRVVGVGGQEVPASFAARFRFLPNITARCRNGTLGCFWSHRLALELVVKLQLRHVIVVEDDACLRRPMPTPDELGDRAVALEGELATPGAWKRATSEFGVHQRFKSWRGLVDGINEVDFNRFTLLGTGALYLPGPEVAHEMLTLMDVAPRLKAIDTWYREHRVIKHLFFPNVFACDDGGSSQIDQKSHSRDLYISRRRDLVLAAAEREALEAQGKADKSCSSRGNSDRARQPAVIKVAAELLSGEQLYLTEATNGSEPQQQGRLDFGSTE